MSTELVASRMGAGIYAKPLSDGCVKHGIISVLERAHLLAQVAHESDDFATTEEYASGRAYEERKDLGNIRPGDGALFKGHGLIQVTGRSNHTCYSQWKYGDDRAVKDPLMLTRLPDAVDAVFWYWTKERPLCRFYAQADNLEAVTRQINGGLHGVNDRRLRLQRAKSLFREIEDNA